MTVRAIQAFSEEGSDFESELDRFTQHVFDVDGRWAWIVAPQVIKDYRQDFCG